MRYVPSGGPFTMGEDVEFSYPECNPDQGLLDGRTEVTQGLWEDVWGTTWPGTIRTVPTSGKMEREQIIPPIM